MANPTWKKTAERMIPPGHDHITTAPSSNLELEWVHGYRGYDTRNNLTYADSCGNQIFFHAAGVGIVQTIDRSESESTTTGNRKGNSMGSKAAQHFFGEHSDDIISMATRPTSTGSIIATGEVGKTPSICLYEWCEETDTFLSLTSMKGFHSAGVVQMSFSADGKR